MPELPEVETIKKGLIKNIKGKKISSFECKNIKMINLPLNKYKKILTGLEIENIRRRAKMLIIDLSNNWHILIHLKMTGYLVYNEVDYPNKFTRATIFFRDGSQLFFNDIRKFGWARLYNSDKLQEILYNFKLGIEPLSSQFTIDYWRTCLERRPQRNIKQFLMDNTMVVGLGNIYSDEICYYAKIKPSRLIRSLDKSARCKIYQGIKKILAKAIKCQGTTFGHFFLVDGQQGKYYKYLKIYGRFGKKCTKCNTIVKKIKLGGRNSSFCPQCQK